LGRLEAALEPAYAAASTDPRRALAGLIRAFLEFVAADRSFVRLVQHETMRGGGALQEALRGPVLENALAALAAARGREDAREVRDGEPTKTGTTWISYVVASAAKVTDSDVPDEAVDDATGVAPLKT